MEQFLTRKQVAELLVVSEDFVSSLVRRGELAGIRVSERKTRFSREAVDAFIAARTSPAKPPEARTTTES